MASFLTCYDYGQGGVWFYVEAEDIGAISKTYPDLMFFPSNPPWWNEEYEQAARKNAPAKSPFKEILEGARKK